MNKEEILYNKIYERTKDFGRDQFIKEIMRLERVNKQDKLIKYLEVKIKETRIGGCDCLTDKMFETEKRVYQDILERVRSGKYE